jgi:hypothetical protein
MTRRKALLASGYMALLTLMVLGIWKANQNISQVDAELPAGSSELENKDYIIKLDGHLNRILYQTARTVQFQQGPTTYYVTIFRGWRLSVPGTDTQYLLLRDSKRSTLDLVTCSINNRLTQQALGNFITEAIDSSDDNAVRFVLRYVPTNEDEYRGNWSHEGTHRGTVYSFPWNPDKPRAISAADFKSEGLCRLAIKDNKFVVVFPNLNEADGVSIMDD